MRANVSPFWMMYASTSSVVGGTEVSVEAGGVFVTLAVAVAKELGVAMGVEEAVLGGDALPSRGEDVAVGDAAVEVADGGDEALSAGALYVPVATGPSCWPAREEFGLPSLPVQIPTTIPRTRMTTEATMRFTAFSSHLAEISGLQRLAR